MSGHPVWCAEDRNGMHLSEAHVHDNVTAQLMQIHRPALIIGPTWFEVREMRGLANLLSMLGFAELAATVKRLAELAEADAEFIPVAQESLPHHEECVVGTWPNVKVNPTTRKVEHLPVVPA